MLKTKRTQIIDKMDNKQLALYLAYGAHIVNGNIDTANLIDTDDKTRAEIAKNSIEIEKWLSEKAKPGTADEMFEELGYVTFDKHSPFKYTLNRSNTQIIVSNDGYSKHILTFENDRISRTITEAEDKAIHKKIEELKNGK